MGSEEHLQQHKLLHRMLDELIADYIDHGPTDKTLTDTTLIEFMHWSAMQARKPDHQA